VKIIRRQVMANVTMTLDDEIIKKVKKIAVEKNTTLTGIIRDYLTRLAKREDRRTEEVIEELSAIMNAGGVKIGKITWTRDELHER
jgi:predicted transcriptional regulator